LKKKVLRSIKRIKKEFKLAAVQRMLKGENVSHLASELKISRSMLYEWRTQVRKGALLGQEEAKLVAAKNRIGELERLVGQLTFENRFFANALQRVEAARRPNGKHGKPASLPRFRQ
jgi:transposase-like protein